MQPIKNKHNVIIFHGYNGSPNRNWFPWLTQELSQHAVQVSVPEMPLGNEQSLENWLKKALELKESINKNTILIGHSLGAALIMNLLPQLDSPVKATYLVGGFASKVESDDQEIDDTLNPFVANLSWKKIRKNGGRITNIFSDGDPFISNKENLFMAGMLKSNNRIIAGGKHFRQEDKYEKFPALLEMILDTIYVTYGEFKKLNLQIGHIKEVEPVEESDKLLKFQIDFGEERPRQIVSGIRGYNPDYENLVGKKVLYITNLAPRQIMGITSEGMLMAVGDGDTDFAFMQADQDVAPGSSIR